MPDCCAALVLLGREVGASRHRVAKPAEGLAVLMGAEPPLPHDDHVRLLVPRADKIWQTKSMGNLRPRITSDNIFDHGTSSSPGQLCGMEQCGVGVWVGVGFAWISLAPCSSSTVACSRRSS